MVICYLRLILYVWIFKSLLRARPAHPANTAHSVTGLFLHLLMSQYAVCSPL